MKKRWNVYLPFMTNELKRNLAYKGSFYLFILCSVFSSFISYYLWMAIYGSSAGQVLGGLTRNEMITYVFMTYVTSNLVMVSIGYRMSLIAKASGTLVYRFLAPSVFIWIGLEIYKVNVLRMEVTPIPNILLYLLSTGMSFFLYVLFDFCFGMIAFVTTYMFGMMMAKDAILAFLSGQLIPISFFPGTVQKIFEYLPFSSMIYTPVMVYLGKYSGMDLVFVLFRQFVWIVILYAAGSFLWQRITRRLVVLGG